MFDDKTDPVYSEKGGFFPIDDELFGNSPGPISRNFHFTFELHTQFTYNADQQNLFRFTGDDDVWVFINGKLVIDIGGVHSAVDQTIDLDRLGLEDGETYSLDFFFAEPPSDRVEFQDRDQSRARDKSSAPMTAAYD